MTKLRISPDLSLPLDFVTSTQAILAKKGKGKTYKASVEAEELLDAGQQIVAIDPTGAWWGLRSSADGRSAGYPIIIFGGEHADVALEPTAGEVIADAIASEHFSAVIDLTLFRKGEALRFMATFLETLYRKNRAALHLFIDEADVVAPQKTFGPDEARVLGACEDIVRRGRIRGIGCTLITQRPQVLNKNVLSQVDMLTALGMNHPKDIGAIKEWVAVHGDEAKAKQMISDLPALPQGEAWIWAPAADIFKRVTFRDRRTFDSGKTPKAGETRAAPKVIAAVDIARLGQTIAATVEQQKANDPKALKARVAELEKQIAARPSEKVEKREPAPKLDSKQLAGINKIATLLVKEGDRLVTAIGSLDAQRDRLAQAQQAIVSETGNLVTMIGRLTNVSPIHQKEIDAKYKGLPNRAPFTPSPHPVAGVHRAEGERTIAQRRASAGETALPIGERATLSALIQYPDGLERRQLTVLTSYKRSTRDAYIARLRDRGFVDTNGDRVLATDAGRDALPDAEALPVGAALQQFWFAKLPAGEAEILKILVEVYPEPIRKDALDESTGFKRSTRDAYLSRLAAKELVVEPGRGEVRAVDTLFDGAV